MFRKQQICFTFSRKMGDQLRKMAEKERRSVSNLIAKILEDFLLKRSKEPHSFSG
jgi:hypothetical protein